jgi:hypothetical protein
MILAALLAAGSAVAVSAAAYACYDPNEGAFWQSGVSNARGLRADVDFVSAPAPNGRAIVHPMQIQFASGDFAGWGTAKGIGADGAAGKPSCPDDYTKWSTYLDGRQFGDYFCQQLSSWPEYSGTDVGIPFKFSLGNGCTFSNVFRFYADGALITCADFNGIEGMVSIGGEVIPAGSNLPLDHHYYHIDRMDSSGNWQSLSGGSGCSNSGYRVRSVAGDDKWVEETP